VGNVEFLDLYPLNFNEFILAHEDEMISDLFSDVCHAHKITEAGHQRLTELYHYFSFVGGMPRVVNTYLGSRKQDLFNMTQEVRKAQKDLVESYHKDFAKHAGKINSMHIVSVFENVPMQLARCLDGSVQRYRFRDVIPGKKSFVDLQGPIDWLEKAGLIIKVKICKRPEIPLESFCEQNLFKLYVLDSGVLGSMLNIPPEIFITGDYSMTKGFVAENFVATELLSSNNQSLHSWTGKNSEIEFIHLMKNEVIPVEVKAGNRTHAKSLGVYFKKYSPKFAVKLSARMPNAFRLGGVNQVPLYLAGQLGMLFNELV
jgi:predicted AAA+ superfamily ATPase